MTLVVGGPVERLVVDMFGAIDGGRFDALPHFFHDEVTYDRPGFAPVRGLTELLHFYRNIRPIARGRHDLDRILSGGPGAVSFGVFRGMLRNGRAVEERFADYYGFRDGLIAERATFFFRPAI